MNELMDSTFDDKYGQMHYWLNLSKEGGEQVGLVAAARDKRTQMGTPVQLTRDADNRDIKPDTSGRVAPNLRDAILRDPGMAAYFKDELPKWDAFSRRVFGLGSEDVLLNAIEEQVQKYGLDAADSLSDERRESYLNDSGRSWSERPRSRTFRNAVVAVAEQQQKENVLSKIDKLSRINAAINMLNYSFPQWRKDEDDALLDKLKSINEVAGFKTDDITLEEMRETQGYDYEAAFNFFGIRDIISAYKKTWGNPDFTPERLALIDENAPMELQIAKLQMLEEERDALKGSTWDEKVVNSFLSSLPFVAEFAATGGWAGAPEAAFRTLLTKGWWKAGFKSVLKTIGKGTGIAAKSAALRAPLYFPKNAAEAVNNNYYGGAVTIPIGDGKLSIEVKDEQARDLFQGFVSAVLSQFGENVTEELGNLIPFSTRAQSPHCSRAE